MTILRVTRREFVAGLGSAASWPVVARGQRSTMPTIGFLNGGSSEASVRNAMAFRKGLSETGYVDGRNVLVEYHWLEGQYQQVPILVADLVRRNVNVIACPGFAPGALAAKASTKSIPIVFGVGDDPVRLGLVTSLARPTENVTGINFFIHEVVSKRLSLLHELVPRAARVAVLVNPGNADAAEATVKEAREAAPALDMQIVELQAATPEEINAAFSRMADDQIEALFLAGDAYLFTRRAQFAALAARDRVPTISWAREFTEAGGLVSYGTVISDMHRQVGIYAGTIIKGVKPSDLPVLQSAKFELVVNLKTARELGIDVPPLLLARADEVIE